MGIHCKQEPPSSYLKASCAASSQSDGLEQPPVKSPSPPDPALSNGWWCNPRQSSLQSCHSPTQKDNTSSSASHSKDPVTEGPQSPEPSHHTSPASGRSQPGSPTCLLPIHWHQALQGCIHAHGAPSKGFPGTALHAYGVPSLFLHPGVYHFSRAAQQENS